MLKLSGKKPGNLGLKNNKLSKCSWKPNCVCSQYKDDVDHYIEPLLADPFDATWRKLVDVILDDNSATIKTQNENYLHVEYSSKLLGFVDDVEFLAEPEAGLIQVRSASRLGVRDFGVNRKRIEAIRSKLG